jgi:hypothetical protein
MVGARGGDRGQVLHAAGEAVAHPLELGQAEQHRTAAHAARRFRLRERAERRIRRDVREAGGHDPRELVLQARDLAAQRSARGALGVLLELLPRGGRKRCHGLQPVDGVLAIDQLVALSQSVSSRPDRQAKSTSGLTRWSRVFQRRAGRPQCLLDIQHRYP